MPERRPGETMAGVTVAVMLFTRDLRVHDNLALVAAAKADHTVPLFVLDETILRADFNRPNRAAFLAESLADLDQALRERGGGLVVRRGEVTAEVLRVARDTAATDVHVAADVSGHARRRQEALREALARDGRTLHLHEGVTVVPPGAVTPQGGGGKEHMAVFTSYFRRWEREPARDVLPAPRAISLPRVARGKVPGQQDICAGETSAELACGGETEGRRRADAWFEEGLTTYDDRHDDLAGDATSRLSPYLHFGCLSPNELVRRAGTRSAGAAAFVRQVAWRDFHHQVLAARPDAATVDYRGRGDSWRRDEDDLAAWRAGRTGYPIVDAGMRQLAREGWMHNRARLVTASFLTKTLYLDWRLGARHFFDLLIDGDMANNTMNWQWIAGTGTDTRPNRVHNPLRQAHRYDPDGDYVRRYVPELAGVAGGRVHEPWRLPDETRRGLDYPERIVDHDESVHHFLRARGRSRGKGG